MTGDNELRDVWDDWLGQWAWEWFVTLTFRDSIGVDAAENRWEKWIRIHE